MYHHIDANVYKVYATLRHLADFWTCAHILAIIKIHNRFNFYGLLFTLFLPQNKKITSHRNGLLISPFSAFLFVAVSNLAVKGNEPQSSQILNHLGHMLQENWTPCK